MDSYIAARSQWSQIVTVNGVSARHCPQTTPPCQGGGPQNRRSANTRDASKKHPCDRVHQGCEHADDGPKRSATRHPSLLVLKEPEAPCRSLLSEAKKPTWLHFNWLTLKVVSVANLLMGVASSSRGFAVGRSTGGGVIVHWTKVDNITASQVIDGRGIRYHRRK